MTTETSNARGEWVLVPRALLDEARNIAMEWTLKGRVPECGKFGQIAQDLDAMLAAAPPPAAARGDVPYDRELIAQMLDAAEAPAFTMEEMDTQARLLREAAQAKPEAQGGESAELRRMVAKLAAHVRPTCGELWAEAERLLNSTAPPSAPVGVEAIAAEIRASLGRGATVCTRRRWAIELEALAQQPAAVDEAAAIRAFEEHFQASSDDPYFEGELELWLTAWRKALAAQRQEPTT